MKKRKSKRNIKKSLIFGILVILILIIIIFATLSFLSKRATKELTNREPVLVTPEILPSYLSNFNMVNDLPKEANINIKFGDYDYIIKKGSVLEGIAENPDISINLPEEYISKLGYGLCEAIQEAIKNNDIGIELSVSNTELLWRYKGMLKYRDCVGL